MDYVYNIGFHIGEIPCMLVSVNPNNDTLRKTFSYYDHCHHYLELHYVLEGTCSLLCAQELVNVKQGELLLIPPNMYHRETYVSDGCKKMSVSLNLSPPAIPAGGADTRFYDCFAKMSRPLCFQSEAEMEQYLGQIRTYAQEDDNYIIREKLKLCGNGLLLSLYEHLSRGQCFRAEDSYRSIPSREYVINNFFAKNYMSGAAKEELAQMLHISTRQLHRIMQKMYGVNYRQQQNQMRLKIAAGFLHGTDKSIAEISELMGYSSPANFATFIKKATGKTPGQIRKEGKI